jgi:spermidine synthase
MSIPAAAPTKRLFPAFLVLTALVCGALIMVVEVLGSRVIGPLFGVSLFVWTSLITVTMVALAAGYAAGGLLADRRGHPDWLYGLIGAAGALVALVPLAKGPVLKACLPLGLRAGALASSLLLFGPALLLLGCVSPYLIRIAAREMRSIGRTVGSFYAISTVGSVVGTVGAGFVLVAWLSVDQIFFLVSALLVGLALAYFALFRRQWLALPAALLLGFTWPQARPVDKVMANGTRVQLVARQDGHYGSLKVVDYSFGARRTREMIVDGVVQGGIDLTTGQSIYPYYYLLGLGPQRIAPGGADCLVMGLGPGVIPAFYERAGVRTDVIDIDPAVVDFARRYFGFRNSGATVIEDARYFLQTGDKRYDYIVLDVFNGDTTPTHILSLEAFRLIRARLKEGGVLALNLLGDLRGETLKTASVVRTLREVFPTVDIYPNFDPTAGEGMGNLSLFAYAGPAVAITPELFAPAAVHPMAARTLAAIPRWKFEFPPGTPAMLLTDGFNPIDCFDIRHKEQIRSRILATTDWDILIL